jgi:pimeloyl-ACP methyl ester carboxylesterase
VKRLLLVDSATAPFSLPFKGRITRIPGIGELIFKRVYGRAMFFRYFREDIFFDENKINEASLSAYYEGFDRNRDSALSAVRTAADPGPVYEKLSRIACPTFVLWGRNDPLIPFRAAGETAARIPGSVSAVIEQCGHSPFEEQPEETLRLINQFLST